MKNILLICAGVHPLAVGGARGGSPVFTFSGSDVQVLVRSSCVNEDNYSVTTRGHGSSDFTARLPLGATFRPRSPFTSAAWAFLPTWATTHSMSQAGKRRR